MDETHITLVSGACAPERRQHAERMARHDGAALVPAAALAGSPDPVVEAVTLADWRAAGRGAVVELPDEVLITEAIGAFADETPRLRVAAHVCVVDAVHLVDDLQRDDYLPLRDDESGVHAPLVARAEITVRQIEFASVVVLVNWEQVPTAELSMVMALVSHLSPRARLRLDRGIVDPPLPGAELQAAQDGPGWLCLLNGEFRPHMTDPRVHAFRYEQPRPLHPGRLRRVLDRISAEEFGCVLRSVGFARLATRPSIVAQWEHVGCVLSLSPLSADAGLDAEGEVLAIGQDLAVLGIDLDAQGLASALDAAALTDAELAAGPGVWARFADPFPRWPVAPHRAG